MGILKAAGAGPKPPELPVFTANDLLDFHFALEQDDWLEELRRSASGT